MITELLCTAVALGLYLNTLDADFCYDDRGILGPRQRCMILFEAAANPWLPRELLRPQSTRPSARTGPPNLSPTTLTVYTPYVHPKTLVSKDNTPRNFARAQKIYMPKP
ncbi:hypothetical protein NQZ68_021119 [Dissostichus eleginoides]|nr:hypothetical protein NQZ68_021119 [Dissostichus eleginoides]